MKAKVIAAAFASALLGLSAASFAQTTPGTRGPTQGTFGQDNPGANETPATGTATGAGAALGATSAGANTVGGGTVVACDSLTGTARDNCLRDNASRGASGPAYVPQRPAMSNDKNDPIHPNTREADQVPSRSQ
jgi:hypothetical protein